MDSNLPPDNNPPPAYNPPPVPPSFHRPPPVIAPTAAPVRKSRGWMIFAVVLLVLLVLSVLLNFTQVVASVSGGRIRTTHSTGPRMEEITVRDNDSAHKIAVIPVDGIISGDATDGTGLSIVSLIKEQLKRADKDKDVRAVILKINSPGGEVLASDEIAVAIRDFEAKARKPVVVSMGSLAASGGYYISAPCDWIVANELTITGSIGVIMEGINYRGLMDKVGVRPEIFKSGKYKDMLSPMKTPEETSPEEKQMVQALVNETFGKFKDVVKNGREGAFSRNPHSGDPAISQQLSSDWADYADGRILSGKEALRLGFVDELGDFDVALNRAEKLAGISSANVIQYQPMFDLANFLHLLGKTDVPAVKIDLGLEIPKIHPNCQYFLPGNYL